MTVRHCRIRASCSSEQLQRSRASIHPRLFRRKSFFCFLLGFMGLFAHVSESKAVPICERFRIPRVDASRDGDKNRWAGARQSCPRLPCNAPVGGAARGKERKACRRRRVLDPPPAAAARCGWWTSGRTTKKPSRPASWPSSAASRSWPWPRPTTSPPGRLRPPRSAARSTAATRPSAPASSACGSRSSGWPSPAATATWPWAACGGSTRATIWAPRTNASSRRSPWTPAPRRAGRTRAA
ncbi:hypothetical protein SEVIR_3G128150v4 [Setaria viridis]